MIDDNEVKKLFTDEMIHKATNGDNSSVSRELSSNLDAIGIDNLALWLTDNDFFVSQEASPEVIKDDFCFWFCCNLE